MFLHHHLDQLLDIRLFVVGAHGATLASLLSLATRVVYSREVGQSTGLGWWVKGHAIEPTILAITSLFPAATATHLCGAPSISRCIVDDGQCFREVVVPEDQAQGDE